ncbi:MAG: hypothetical protein M0037_04850 [Betaproteobacteria bacterium]|nr:hypothetical protein [Betaproteobacteria bacterium]
MTKKMTTALLMSLLLAGSFATTAAAQMTGAPPGTSPAMTKPHPLPHYRHHPARRYRMRVMGSHYMVGTVEHLNRGRGTFELKSKPENLRLHFPPASLRTVKDGDTLRVHLSFTKEGAQRPMNKMR